MKRLIDHGLWCGPFQHLARSWRPWMIEKNSHPAGLHQIRHRNDIPRSNTQNRYEPSLQRDDCGVWTPQEISARWSRRGKDFSLSLIWRKHGVKGHMSQPRKGWISTARYVLLDSAIKLPIHLACSDTKGHIVGVKPATKEELGRFWMWWLTHRIGWW